MAGSAMLHGRAARATGAGMRVLGIDPGTATTGWGVGESRGTRLIHIAHGTVKTPAGLPFQARLDRIYAEVRSLIVNHRPDGVSIEELFFTKNITTGIAVAQARGVIALAAVHAGLSIGEF